MERKTEFVCENCDDCCRDQTTQINLTLLDIKWLCDYLNMPLKKLFDKRIVAFVPFIREDDFSKFNIELGMRKPCVLLKDKRCSAYDSRPMNCRTFPYWLINHQIEDEGLECIRGVEPDFMTRTLYREYERMVGKILLTESEKTDAFMKSIEATQEVDISLDPDFKRISKNMQSVKDRKEISKLIGELIKLAEKNIEKELHKKIPLVEKEIKKNSYEELINQIIAAEVMLDGEITSVSFK